MHRLDEFQRLSAEWQEAKQATAMAQMALDLKISSFLSGFGAPPTIDEQDLVDNLRAKERELRGYMDEFVFSCITGETEVSGVITSLFPPAETRPST
jgi:hypothetical protein